MCNYSKCIKIQQNKKGLVYVQIRLDRLAWSINTSLALLFSVSIGSAHERLKCNY